MNERHWYHLHLVTCVVLLVTGMLWPANLQNLRFYWPFHLDVGFGSGRPFVCAAFVVVIDIAVFFVLLSCTATLLEKWLRNPVKFQLRMGTALGITAILGCLLALWTWETAENQPREIHFLASLLCFGRVKYFCLLDKDPGYSQWPSAIPVYLALGCTIYMASCGVAWLVRRFVLAFRPSPSTDGTQPDD